MNYSWRLSYCNEINTDDVASDVTQLETRGGVQTARDLRLHHCTSVECRGESHVPEYSPRNTENIVIANCPCTQLVLYFNWFLKLKFLCKFTKAASL